MSEQSAVLLEGTNASEPSYNSYLLDVSEDQSNGAYKSSKSAYRRRPACLLLLIVTVVLLGMISFASFFTGHVIEEDTDSSPSDVSTVKAGKFMDGEAPTVDGEAPTLDEDEIVKTAHSEGEVSSQVFVTLQPSCVDGLQNLRETGVDCGGPDCPNPCDQLITLEPSLAELPDTLRAPYAGALEGGPTGTYGDTLINNIITQDVADNFLPGLFNIPTDGKPSPRFGVNDFTAKFVRFEEFGMKPLPPQAQPDPTAHYDPVPQPSGFADHSPLDNWLRRRAAASTVEPYPAEYSITYLQNPWVALIGRYLGKAVNTAPLEGRPPSYNWKHQRWFEFFPQEFIETATVGARTNRGERNALQRHRYSLGEFGPGGLYNQVAPGNAPDRGTNGVEVKFHPTWPRQEQSSVWQPDGSFPPKLIQARYGFPILFRHWNALPVDVTANRGFGIHTLSTHEHNGHTPAESDGYAASFFFPGQFYDYHWPMVVAGHDTINVNATDPRMATPLDGPMLSMNLPGDYREIMSTHWFHDHMLDWTAQNTYKGMVGCMNYYSAIDRGAEHIADNINLRFPSGTSLPWGNRDYDLNFVISDKAFDKTGQLWFNPWNVGGFVGDLMTVNVQYKPVLEVRARKYRFRILDASVSRLMQICLATKNPAINGGNYVGVGFHLIANDGNIMEHSIYFASGCLPMMGIAERFDIIVDFSKFVVGTELYFINTAEHLNGIKVNRLVPLSDIHLYQNHIAPTVVSAPGVVPPIIADRYVGDPGVGVIAKVVVVPYTGTDLSMNPADYEEGKLKMIPVRRLTQQDLQTAIYHDFTWKKQAGGGNRFPSRPWTVATDAQGVYTIDPRRTSVAATKNSNRYQVWRIASNGGWSHPIHMHFEEAVVLSTDGEAPAKWDFYARKDIFIAGGNNAFREWVIAFQQREFHGTYVMHCHNTQHEDWAMMLRWDVEVPGQINVLPNTFPTYEGVQFSRQNQVLEKWRSGIDPASIVDTTTTTGTTEQIFDPLQNNLPNIIVPQAPGQGGPGAINVVTSPDVQPGFPNDNLFAPAPAVNPNQGVAPVPPVNPAPVSPVNPVNPSPVNPVDMIPVNPSPVNPVDMIPVNPVNPSPYVGPATDAPSSPPTSAPLSSSTTSSVPATPPSDKNDKNDKNKDNKNNKG